MEGHVNYLSRDDLPQFSNFDYSEEPPEVPVLEEDYSKEDVKALLSEEDCVLIQSGADIDAMRGIVEHGFQQLMSFSEVKDALNPMEARGVTDIYTAENENSFYVTRNQRSLRFL